MSTLLQDCFENLQPVPGSNGPLFYATGAEFNVLYTPGRVFAAGHEVSDALLARQGNNGQATRDTGAVEETATTAMDQAAHSIGHAVREARARIERQEATEFVPECLMVFLNERCQLDCAYCHAEPGNARRASLDPAHLTAATEYVADACAQHHRRLQVVFHGGGEPMLDRALIDAYLPRLHLVATERTLTYSTYMATNGAVDENDAHWLAEHIALVGLSCDGPPDIQNRQRPFRGGRASSEMVERTGRILSDGPCALHVRATITPATCHRLPEIIDYIQERFSPTAIRLEPLYENPRAKTNWRSEDARRFALAFAKAGKVAEAPLLSSACRPYQLYGPYCYTLQDTLTIVPGGAVTNCFKGTNTEVLEALDRGVGHFDGALGRYVIETARIAAMRARSRMFPPGCETCFNRYHCTLGCPDVCLLRAERPGGAWQGFLCDLQRIMSLESILSLAKAAWEAADKRGLSKRRLCGVPIPQPDQLPRPRLMELAT